MDFIFICYLSLIGALDFVSVINLITAPKLLAGKPLSDIKDLISVIIPMRNEVNNAENIINDLLAQAYVNLEIIAVDDNSTDGTWEVLQKFTLHKNFKWISLGDKPEEWIGKSWALWEGLHLAKGDVFVFVDADVRMDKLAIAENYIEMTKFNVGVLNCFPRQIAPSLGEKMIVPLMNWSTVGFFPVSLVNKSTLKRVFMANGQFIMCHKEEYEKIGGHESVKSLLNEDSAIINRFKEEEVRIRVVLGDNLVTCRMYKGYADARKGFGRSLVSAFGGILLFMTIVIFWMLMFLMPYAIIFIDSRFIWVILGILIHRLITSIIYRENPFINMFLHPIQMLILLEISIYSIYLKLTKNIIWKGRAVK